MDERNLTRPPPPPPEPSFPPRPPPPPPPPTINTLTLAALLSTVKVPLLVKVCIVLSPLVVLVPPEAANGSVKFVHAEPSQT